MLLLSRRRQQSVLIGDEIEIKVLKIDKSQVYLGIQAPKNVSIFRNEIYQALKKANQSSVLSFPHDIQKAMKTLKKNPN